MHGIYYSNNSQQVTRAYKVLSKSSCWRKPAYIICFKYWIPCRASLARNDKNGDCDIVAFARVPFDLEMI